MAVCKCKMCGGNLIISEVDKIAECDYCGTVQTVPSADSEKKLTLFNRANRLRMNSEFDKAAGVYESIVSDFPEEAEAYWGLVLCKYGIEYVDDPATGQKIPTCHRSSFDSVMEDENFDQACENADAVARRVYREEAKRIEELRKGIIEVSSKEDPYDIFICYKETDENGDRTVDSVIAQDVYAALTEKGYRVFFSRISLEDKLGMEYEPYIFAALNSAKIMLAFGTDYEYYNAVWVKNEWSRFLQLIAAGEKKTLIPCYKGIDAYDMPKEFARLQAQNMGKVGALQDLLRGIDKVLKPDPAAERKTDDRNTVNGPTTDSYIKRAYLLLEDGDFEKAGQLANSILNIDPECAEGYLIQLMANRQAPSVEALEKNDALLAEEPLFKRAISFTDETNRGRLNDICEKNTAYVNARKARFNELQEKGRQIGFWEMILKREDYFYLDNGKVKLNEQCKETEFVKLYHNAVESWNDIVEITPFRFYYFRYGYSGNQIYEIFNVFGVKKDGTVLYAGDDEHGQNGVLSWHYIKSVKIFGIDAEKQEHPTGNVLFCIVGLRNDGTCVACGDFANAVAIISKWSDVFRLDAFKHGIVKLLTNGRVNSFYSAYKPNNRDNFSGFSACFDWKNVFYTCLDFPYDENDFPYKIYGLTEDNRVVEEYSTGSTRLRTKNSDGTYEMDRVKEDINKLQQWNNVKAIYPGGNAVLFDGSAVSTSIKETEDLSEIVGSFKETFHSYNRLFYRKDGLFFKKGRYYFDEDIVANGKIYNKAGDPIFTDVVSQCSVGGFEYRNDNRTDRQYVATTACAQTFYLKTDGTVIADTYKYEFDNTVIDHSDVKSWRNVVFIAAKEQVVYGITADGECLQSGQYFYTVSGRSPWTSLDKTIATKLKLNIEERYNELVAEWEAIDRYHQYERDYALASKKEILYTLKAKLLNEKSTLESELATLQGLFKGNRRKEVEAQLAEVESRLQYLG